MARIQILALNGSPVKGGNTGILIDQILKGAQSLGADCKHLSLNDLVIKPCQSCGESPEPDLCFLHDDMDPVYGGLRESDAFVLGSPIYFDTVSAQMKLFIDRCNCLRPLLQRENHENEFYLKPLFGKKRWGVMVLVAGERQEFECARKVLAGFFAWANVQTVGHLLYVNRSWEKGRARLEPELLRKAFDLGKRLAHQASAGERS